MNSASSALGLEEEDVGFLTSADREGESRDIGRMAEAGLSLRGGGARDSSISNSIWCLDLRATRLPSLSRSFRASCSSRSTSSFDSSVLDADSLISLVERLLESSSCRLCR